MMLAMLSLLSSITTAHAASFPSYTLESLAGTTRTIPTELGPESIVAVAFSREHAAALETWEAPLKMSGLPFVAMLWMGEMNSALKSTISLAMRATLESEREARTYLLVGGNEGILSVLQSQDISELVVLRIANSEVVREVRGAWSAAGQAALGL